MFQTEGYEIRAYQNDAKHLAFYPKHGSGDLQYPVLGLVGEAGEVANKLKKVIRDKHGIFDENDRHEFALELGDVLWYLSQICEEMGLQLDEVAQLNIAKLSHRRKESGR